jgi:cell division protein FtsW
MQARRPLTNRVQAGASQRRHRPDYWLLMLAMALLSVGLVVIYSISPGLSAVEGRSDYFYINKQLLAVGLGLMVFAGAANLPLKLWKLATLPLAGLAIVTTFIVSVISLVSGSPTRWINLGSFSFQPAEVVKLAVILGLALFLAERKQSGDIGDLHKTFKPIGIVFVILAVLTVIVERDLGSMGVITMIMAVMMFLAGVPMKRLLSGIGVVMAFGVLAVIWEPYRRDRMLTFLHPERDCLDAGYQACQALSAVGSGGVLGLGLGNSIHAYGYLPEAANDSIFAIYAEKFGFFGVIALLVLFALFFTRIKTVMERSPDMYSQLLAAGVFIWLSVQSIINIGAMMGLFPLKGITLPFISYGGTSVVFVMAALGLVFQLSRYTTYAAGAGDTGMRIRQ